MSAEPVWWLFRIQPQDSENVKKAFDKAIKQSKVAQKLEGYLQNRDSASSISIGPFSEGLKFLEMLRKFPQAFENISNTSDCFDWKDAYETAELFFPKAFEKMLEHLFVGASPIISVSMEDATIEFMSSRELGASQFLYAGLVWERAGRLPGYCGNIFIPPDKVQDAVRDMETNFREVKEKDFFARAYAIGAGGSGCNVKKLFSLPLILSKVLREGNGFLALNYSHIGNFPASDDEEYDIY